MKLALQKNQMPRTSERGSQLIRQGLGAKEGKRLRKASTPTLKDQERHLANDAANKSNVVTFFQAMHERLEQNMQVLEFGHIKDIEEIMNLSFQPPKKEAMNILNDLPPNIPPPVLQPVPIVDGINEESKKSQTSAEKAAEETLATIPPRKPLLVVTKTKPQASTSLSVDDPIPLDPERMLTPTQPITPIPQPEVFTTLRPRASSESVRINDAALYIWDMGQSSLLRFPFDTAKMRYRYGAKSNTC